MEDTPSPDDDQGSYLTRADLTAFADRLGDLIRETPEERRARQHHEREAAFAEAGETKTQRKTRHHAEKLDRERRSRALWRLPFGEDRAWRFRRWCALTGASASLGYALGLIQFIGLAPFAIRVGAAVVALLLDLRVRSWGRTRVSEVRGFNAVAVLVVARIPVASAIAAVLDLGPLLALPHH